MLHLLWFLSSVFKYNKLKWHVWIVKKFAVASDEYDQQAKKAVLLVFCFNFYVFIYFLFNLDTGNIRPAVISLPALIHSPCSSYKLIQKVRLGCKIK